MQYNTTVFDTICNTVQLYLIQYAIQYNCIWCSMQYNTTVFDTICNTIQLYLIQYAIQYNCILYSMQYTIPVFDTICKIIELYLKQYAKQHNCIWYNMQFYFIWYFPPSKWFPSAPFDRIYPWCMATVSERLAQGFYAGTDSGKVQTHTLQMTRLGL